jgi:hypothetical protein
MAEVNWSVAEAFALFAGSEPTRPAPRVNPTVASEKRLHGLSGPRNGAFPSAAFAGRRLETAGPSVRPAPTQSSPASAPCRATPAPR